MKNLIFALFGSCILAAGAFAQTATLTSSGSTYSTGGGTLTFTAALSFTQDPTTVGAIGWTVNLPTGWALVSSTGPGGQPAGTTGALDWFYIDIPASPATFTFAVSYPSGLTGSQTVTSAVVFRENGVLHNLTPTALTFTLGNAVPASITTPPASVTKVQGQTATFTVVAAGSPTPAYQWKRNTTVLTDAGTISGSSSATLTISNVQSGDQGSYTVTVSNSAGTPFTSAAATLTVTVPPAAPTITTQPAASAPKRVGDSVTFTVVATGSPTPIYQWKKNGANFGVATTSASLTLTNLQLTDAGSYTVVASNGISPDATSTAATLTVNPVLAFTLQPVDTPVLTGGTAVFTVMATGVAPLSYKWYYAPTVSGSPVALADATGKLAGTQTATLTISNAQTTDLGYYICTVTETGGASRSSSAAQLSIVPRVVRIVSQTAAPGAQVVVPVELVATGVENTISFSLDFDASALSYVTSALGTDAAGATLTRNVTQKDSGKITFLVGKESGTVFAAGTRTILTITFGVNANASDGALLGLTFNDTPTARRIINASSTPLDGAFVSGAVTVSSGLEGDVNGDGQVDAADWVKLGRYVVGLDPMPTGSVFMKADIAPRTSKGDGIIDAADWVQLGRFVVGLDTPQPAGGPSVPAQ